MSATHSSAAPVYGLVLAGGRSTRMQRDKAVLSYHGTSQLERAMQLLEGLVARSFVSVRADQVDDPVRARFAQIVDRGASQGPITGILAAQQAYPQAAWLVLACDLPFLTRATLERLLRERRAERQATAYRSSHDGLPEPLCAVYEPASAVALAAYVSSGRQCPRKFLLQADAALLEPSDPRALDNVNTPEEHRAVLASLGGAAPSAAERTLLGDPALNIRVQYYALLREQAGRSEEALSTRARTPRELYQELRERYPFSLAPESLRVAVNAEFGEWSQPLAEGDSVVFIPPVAGG
ncbi:MAG TPA: NTP transferase domain-containing protein [Steroidobacteraceae bacterium]|nr:NTP transferase domain-containing protein [Steroidobacteraceae bacterium]